MMLKPKKPRASVALKLRGVEGFFVLVVIVLLTFSVAQSKDTYCSQYQALFDSLDR